MRTMTSALITTFAVYGCGDGDQLYKVKNVTEIGPDNQPVIEYTEPTQDLTVPTVELDPFDPTQGTPALDLPTVSVVTTTTPEVPEPPVSEPFDFGTDCPELIEHHIGQRPNPDGGSGPMVPVYRDVRGIPEIQVLTPANSEITAGDTARLSVIITARCARIDLEGVLFVMSQSSQQAWFDEVIAESPFMPLTRVESSEQFNLRGMLFSRNHPQAALNYRVTSNPFFGTPTENWNAIRLEADQSTVVTLEFTATDLAPTGFHFYIGVMTLEWIDIETGQWIQTDLWSSTQYQSYGQWPIGVSSRFLVR